LKQGSSAGSEPHLILVGGGHAHVQVLRAHLMDRLPFAITVVVDRSVAVYSGMVPGVVSGQYRPDEVEIDVRPLARVAGVTFVEAAATSIDPTRRPVHLEGRAPLSYDVASLDVGSTVAGADLPGVAAFALPTRPIGRLLERLDARLAAGVSAVAVVGGGAGGVELAACLRARAGRPTTLIAAGPLVGGGRVGALVERALDERHVARVAGRAAAVDAGGVSLEGGGRVDADLVVWVAGAAGLPVMCGLPLDPRGFVWIDDTLRVEGCADLFAVGDCAVLRSWPSIPKAGVYAVREGPVLIDNLRRMAA
jgi:selenide,water dikinase